MLGQVLDDVSRVSADTGEHRGRFGVQPREPDGIKAWAGGDAAGVLRVPPLVEHGHIHPAEVEPEPGGATDARDSGLLEGEIRARGWHEIVGWRAVIRGSVDACRADVRVEQQSELLVELRLREAEPFHEVFAEADPRSVDVLQAPVEVRALTREPAEVNVVTTVPSRDVRVASEPGRGAGQVVDRGEVDPHLSSVEERLQQPPDAVLPTVPARNAGTHRDREMHLAPRLHQLLGDLRARLPRSDDEHGTGGELGGPAIVARVQLLDVAGEEAPR